MSSVGMGLIGLGTVGSGVIKVIKQNQRRIAERVGAELKFESYCDKFIRSKPELGIKPSQVTQDYRELLRNDSIQIIVELIGGYEPARTIILESLKAGKHVVTANKAVLAKYWDEILQTAERHSRLIYFEAAVGGGIPVIQGLNEGLAANKISKIAGILNGTTNYILTRMTEDGLSFAQALKQAQSSGFAEADPTFDIEGIDSAHKLAVLSSIAFGGWTKISDVYTEGISNLDLLDLQMARKEFGYGLKLLGIAKETNGEVEVRVHPAFLNENHPFLSVKDEYNAISITGNASDDVMFYGKGAGQMAAASAVASDLIFLARHVVQGTDGKLPYVTYDNKKLKIRSHTRIQSRYYLRFMTEDRPGVLSRISGILGKHKVSIASVYQPQSAIHKRVPIVLVTHMAQEGQVQKAISEINRLKYTRAKTVLIRIED